MNLVYAQRDFATETVVRPTPAVVRGQDRHLPFLSRGCYVKQSDEAASISHSGSGAQGGLLDPIRPHRRLRGKGADNANAGGLIA
jgi:hypothetical protein